MDFPFRLYNTEELYIEFIKLQKLINKTCTSLKTIIPIKRIGYKCSNAFFMYERYATPSKTKLSCIEYWNKNKYYITKYHQSSINRDLQASISFLNHVPSQFPVFVASYIYKLFNAKSIFDPYAGWGDRALASININYTGIDSNNNLKPLYENMLNFYKDKFTSYVCMYFTKSETYISNNETTYDLTFTSPPYWDKSHNVIEHYNNLNKGYLDFLITSLIPNIKHALKYSKNVCINMPSNMYDDVLKYSDIEPAKYNIFFKTRQNTKHNKSSVNNIIYCFKTDLKM